MPDHRLLVDLCHVSVSSGGLGERAPASVEEAGGRGEAAEGPAPGKPAVASKAGFQERDGGLTLNATVQAKGSYKLGEALKKPAIKAKPAKASEGKVKLTSLTIAACCWASQDAADTHSPQDWQ